MAWEDDDILRSIRRYLAMTLGDQGQGDTGPWKLRVERREVKDEERPVGVVVAGPISVVRARAALIQGNVEEMMPITISLYPEVAKGTIEDIRSSRLAASRLKSQLKDWLNIGLTLTTTVGEHVRHWAGPQRLPLWDYAGVPVAGDEKAGPTDPHDVLWVDENSISVNAIQDPDDPGRWSVIANFRISVESPGRGPTEAEVMDVDRLVGIEKPR